MNQTKQEIADEILKPETVNACMACGASGLEVMYQVRNVPVQSCLLMGTREEAVKIEKRDITLGWCKGCGFVQNLDFDPLTQNFTDSYEDSQGFSGCFNSFASSLVKRLTDEYEIRDKKVVEIGCGKGDFLSMLCEEGGNYGIGIDPTFSASRLPEKVRKRVEARREFFGSRHYSLAADLICCRHTLEHIQGVREFVEDVARMAANKKDTVVFFELPDTERIFSTGAFWDIYYEHCSYFTMDSLERLFSSAGFATESIGLEYGGQYIILIARLKDKAVAQKPIESKVLLIHNAVLRLLGRQNYWMQYLQQRRNKKIVLWGSGSKAVGFLTGTAAHVEFVVDINPFKHNKYLPGSGQLIVSPEFLKKYRPDEIIVMNPVYTNEISKMLNSMGIKPKLTALQ